MKQKSQSPTKKSQAPVVKKQVVASFTFNENEIKQLDFNKQFNEKQRAKYKEIFIFFDKGATGFVKREDLPFLLRAVGLLVSTYEVRQLAEKLDAEQKGKLTLRQFHSAVYVFKDKKPVKEEIQGSLQIFDKEKEGVVDVQELKQILMNMGDIVNQKEFDSVFGELKIVKGKVKLNEIVDLLMIQPS